MLSFLRKIISVDNPLRLFWHRLKGWMAARWYGYPGKKLICIGITGTNGKTTTTHMTEHVLYSAGKKVAMMSTVEFAMDGKHWVNESKKTTPSAFKTQKFLRDCVKKGMKYAVIESSSHALHQSRLYGIPFLMGALTNITHEHLDYHGTMEKYAEAKKMLFTIISKNPSPKKTAILNIADQYHEKFKAVPIPFQISYGLEQGDLRATNIEYSKHGSKFVLQLKSSPLTAESLSSSKAEGSPLNDIRNEADDQKEVEIDLKMTGAFNIENALAAAGIGLACGLSLKEIKKGLESFEGVAGRMECIKSPKEFEVIVDFALTPDALEKLYSTLRETAEGRIIGLIGSCGDRDKEKRPEMGKIVASYCDLTIVTDEEPYSEDPKQIMEAVLKGAKEVKTLGKDLLLIEDRKDAMDYAIQHAQKGDLVVVTGMGSFNTRTMNDGPMEWDDREVAKELIKKYSE